MSMGFRVSLAAIIVAVGVVVIAGMGDDDADSVTVDMSAISPADRPFAIEAVQRLFAACPGLGRYERDINWFKASVIESDLYDVAAEYGWTRWVTIEVKVAEAAEIRSIPPDWRAWGHHLFYAVGPNGIDVQKGTAGHFCGLGHSTGFITTE